MQAPEVNLAIAVGKWKQFAHFQRKNKNLPFPSKLLFSLGVSSCIKGGYLGGYLTNIQIQITSPSNLPHQLFFRFFPKWQNAEKRGENRGCCVASSLVYTDFQALEEKTLNVW